MQPSAPREMLATRFKGQIATAYLTLASIIQGVLISALVVRVEATYTHFDTADWLLTAATLLAFLLIWHEYLMQALAFIWLPTLLDSLIPFAFLVVGLFLAHLVYGNQRAWLLAAAVRFAVGVAAWWSSQTSAQAYAEENVAVVGALARLSMARLALTVFPAVVFLGAWALYDVLRLGQARVVVAAVALLLVASRIAVTVPYWNRVLAYVRGEVGEA